MAHQDRALFVDSQAAQDLVTRILGAVSQDGDLWLTGIEYPPSSSLTFGGAGIAYALYRFARLWGDTQCLTMADRWIERSLQGVDSVGAYYNDEIGITRKTVGQVSPYHTASGLYCVGAMIKHATRDNPGAASCMSQFVACIAKGCRHLDLVLGLSGVVLAGSLLIDEVQDMMLTDGIVIACDRVLRDIWTRIDLMPPVSESNEVDYLGMAHGWAGILYASMRWARSTGLPLPANLAERLEQLAGCAKVVGSGAAWDLRIGSSSPRGAFWGGWCNGAAGFIHLWTLAYRLLREDAYRTLAERAALSACRLQNVNSASLCCGLAGTAYAVLNLYRCVGDHVWLSAAHSLADRAVTASATAKLPVDNIYSRSLYKGDLGIALLAAELCKPEAARMPFFESNSPAHSGVVLMD